MEKIVQKDEILYRAIKRSRPDSLDENGNPTSALFKQEDGVSVDRDGERTEMEIIGALKQNLGKRFKGAVKVGADVCIDNGMAVIPAPTENIYHAEIYENMNKEELSSLHALILADNAQIVTIEKVTPWTNL